MKATYPACSLSLFPKHIIYTKFHVNSTQKYILRGHHRLYYLHIHHFAFNGEANGDVRSVVDFTFFFIFFYAFMDNPLLV